MTIPTPEEIFAHNSDRASYCINQDCHHPFNLPDATFCSYCGSPLLLQERFRPIALLGQGGFGRTFKAIDESDPSPAYCAIKQFFPQQQGPGNAAKATELFRQEALRLETLGRHTQIPTYIGYFEQDGSQYLVQEFISGPNLAQELARSEPFNETQIRQLLLDVLPLLQFIHSRRVIHRDVKPENLIRRQSDGCLVLVDFGAAKYATQTTLGKTGTMIGSAAYTAPEQVRGKAVFASDLYSLGVTCIHLLTQIPPFDLFDSGEDAWVWRDYLGSNKVSKSLGNILDKMLQSGTKRRYQSADEVLKDLQVAIAHSHEGKKLLVASTVLLLAWAGLRYLNPPAPQPVSTPKPQVVQKQPRQRQSQARKKTPGPQRGLYGYVENGELQVFPLAHTSVSARISGNISRVEVRQTFVNPFDRPLEAVYKFPLPDEAAVDDMEIQIGDRVIRGTIKERQEAKKIYEEAKKEGRTTGLLEQERANIFTQSLANIKPGEKIDVVIRYTNSLKFEGGDYEFVFPMVVAQRYGSKTAALNPSENYAGGGIDVQLEIDAGVPIADVRSPSHQLSVHQASSTMRVKLADSQTMPNKDLIVRYRVAGEATQGTILTQSNQLGGHFAAYLIPALEYEAKEIVPKDVVFLIDTSGSQSGAPIRQSQELMRQFIQGLNPDDTFAIIDFADLPSQLSPEPLANTRKNRQRAIAYINGLDANGGTELMNGINRVLSFPPAPLGRLRSIVLLTDGLIHNDQQVIGAVAKGLQPGNRVYSFGVGNSTNRFLINRLAELGRGTAEVLPPNEPAREAAKEFFQEINNPVLTNIEVTWEGPGDGPEIYPQRLPDLFANQPLVLYGRQSNPTNGRLRITGQTAGGQPYEKVLNVNFDRVSGNGAIAQLWGRARIKDLMNQIYLDKTESLVKAVTDTALAYQLLSKYTAFVAVSDDVRVKPQEKKKRVDNVKSVPEGSNLVAILLAGTFLGLISLKKFISGRSGEV